MKQLPKGWAIGQLSELVGRGGLCTDGDWVESKDQDPNGEIRLVQLADIGDGVFTDKSSRFLNKSSGERLGITQVREGDILIARMPHPLGRSCIFPKVGYAACTVVDVLIFRSGNTGVSQNCLMHFINSPQARERMEHLSGGSTRQRISGGNLKKMVLPIPPEKEQKRISSKIDSLFNRSDRAAMALNSVSELGKLCKASVFKKHLLSGLCDVSRVKNPAPISIGLPSNKLEAGWVWTKLSDVAKLESGHTPRKSNPLYWENGNIPWISLKDIRAADQKVIFETSQQPNQIGIDQSSARLDHFRPKGKVEECKQHEGYWWLAFDWKNYRCACTFCNSKRNFEETEGGKGSHFPIFDEERRANSSADNFNDEQPAILDPCDPDDDRLIWFDMDGVPEPINGASSAQAQKVNNSKRLFHLHESRICRKRNKIRLDINRYVDDLSSEDHLTVSAAKSSLRRMISDTEMLSRAAIVYLSQHRHLDEVERILNQGV